jgi:hypothetical protein
MKNKRVYSVDDYDIDELYGNAYIDTPEERVELTRDKNIERVRTKTIKSGEMLEVEIYPVYNTRLSLPRATKKKYSRAAQRKLNNRNAVKKIVRLVNTNFKPGVDIWVHLPYDDENLPATLEAAQKNMQNYVKRLKRYAARQDWAELKYVYITEGGGNTNKRFHHHMTVNFPDRDVAEWLWKGGEYPRANRLRDSVFKFEGMARYVSKDPQGSKRYVASRNLKKPIESRADFKFTRGGVLKILQGRRDAKTEFERRYKGYRFLDMKAFISDFVSGAYLYVRMRC